VIGAVVLAAGAGTRFGGTKQVVEIRGKPLAQHAVDAAVAAGVDEIVVVVGHDAELVRSRIRLPSIGRFVENPAFASGMATSLAAGLHALDEAREAAIVLAADQPGITPQHVRSLVEAFAARRSPIVRLRFRSGPGPALLAREVWDEASALQGDTGARELMELRPDLVEEVDVSGDAPRDVDVPEDLRHA
jgi:molybdenum cofactor cytidylyltransferase